MLTFKRLHKTWVLLIDVDEYITFNTIPVGRSSNKVEEEEGEEKKKNDDEPALTLDVAPKGIPTLSEWKEHVYIIDSNLTSRVRIEGTISGIMEANNTNKKEYRDVYDNQKKKNGEQITTHDIITMNTKDPFRVRYLRNQILTIHSSNITSNCIISVLCVLLYDMPQCIPLVAYQKQ